MIEEYELAPFSINVLDKRQTMLEKLVSLIRFSFSEDASKAIASKIRHSYDLYYLANDAECAEYVRSIDFQKDLSELLFHDQQVFNELVGWQTKTITDSPLVKDFPVLWESLRFTYQSELVSLAFGKIPDEKLIASCFAKIMKILWN
ncbi:hypothetical protein EZS27_014271 [termite gut metagenome]|uniref:Uncharacterized protein n=1 Tax=termite gut metagenome TaxID=433724 RepID=A0A5J4RWV6_9ZZZZ